jgi:hypothetical protein
MNPISPVPSLSDLVYILENNIHLSKEHKGSFLDLIKKIQVSEGEELDTLRQHLANVLKEEDEGYSRQILGIFAKKTSILLSKWRFGEAFSRRDIVEEFLSTLCVRQYGDEGQALGSKLLAKESLNVSLKKAGCDPGESASIKQSLLQMKTWRGSLEGLQKPVRDFLVQYDRSSQTITLNAKDAWIDLETGTVTKKFKDPKISDQEMKAIHFFVVSKKKNVERGETVYYSSKNTGLARSIHITSEGRVFIHMNKKTLRPHKAEKGRFVGGDRLLGRGTFKAVTTAMDLETCELFASASMTKEEAKNEVNFLERFKEKEGFPQIESVVEYSVRGRPKVRILYKIADRGDLFTLVKEGKLTTKERDSLAEGLIQGFVTLKLNGILHRDIKLKNILVSGNGKDIKPIIADFGLAVEEASHEKKKDSRGSIDYFSPEYATAYLTTDSPERGVVKTDLTIKATTEKNDIWALGCVLDELYHNGKREFAPTFKGDNYGKAMDIALCKEKKEPVDPSIDHLIWRMLRRDPDERISAEEALKYFQENIRM